MSDVVELVRIINVSILVVTLAILGGRVNRWWCSRWKCLLPAAGTGLISVMVSASTVDALLHDRPGGVGVFLIAVAAVALLMQACTIGLGRSHPHDPHGHGGAYVAFDPADGQPCGPGDTDC